MESAIVTTNSKNDLQLLLTLAKKIGIKSKLLTKEQLEDLGLKAAMDDGRTGKFISARKFLKSLEK